MYFYSSVLSSSHLYLDPGSGSFLLQILLATILGGAFAVKVFWRKIVSFFKKTPEEPPINTDTTSHDEK